MAIARAMLRDAPILILDEPTAALDVESESEVMHALDKLVVGRTVLMISHRLSTLGNVEEIIVLKDGQIAEQGNYAELKRRGGVFAGLLEEQNRYSAEKVGDKTFMRSAYVPMLPREVRGPLPVAPVAPAATEAPAKPGNNSPQIPIPRVAPTVPAREHAVGNAAARGVAGNAATQVAAREEARIVVLVDGSPVGDYALDKPVLTIGRLAENDILIPSTRVSRRHARIIWEGGAWVIEDAESVNGLLYQGRRIERLALRDGDGIQLAPYIVLRFLKVR
jgi:hypothetical protein